MIDTHTHTWDDYYNNPLPIVRLVMMGDCVLNFEVSINFVSGMFVHLMHGTILSVLCT